jgi:hypothetical protein
MARLAFQPQCSRLPIQLRIRAPGVLGPPSEAGHHIFGLSLQAQRRSASVFVSSHVTPTGLFRL